MFIELTCKDNEYPISININHIVAIGDVNGDGTRYSEIYTVLGPIPFEVIETADKIKKTLIKINF